MARRARAAEATPAESAATPLPATKAPAGFDWAVNAVKLNRSIAYVRVANPGIKEKTEEFVQLVQDRYVELGGLLIGQEQGKLLARKNRKNAPEVVNLADNDEDEETGDDE